MPLTSQEEEASPSTSKKVRIESTMGGSHRRKLKKNDTPLPQLPKTIPKVKVEEEDMEQIEYVFLSQRTHLARDMEQERRRSSTIMPPSTPKEIIQVITSEDEKKQWIVDMEGQETNVFDLSNFNFMPINTEMVGENIYDTPTS